MESISSSPSRGWCSDCGRLRNINEFPKKANGEARKTCERHSVRKKRPLAFDDWQETINEIGSWARKVCFTIINYLQGDLLTLVGYWHKDRNQ